MEGAALAEAKATSRFDDCLRLLQELQRDGQLYIAVMPPFAVEFVVDPQQLETRLGRRGLTAQQFDRECRDIAGLLYAILSEREESYKSRAVEDVADQQERDTRKAQIDANLNAVRNAFVTQRLQDRYHLKITSKAPSFLDIDWDAKVKVRDAQRQSLRLPYATCKLKFQREFNDSPFTVVSGRIFDAVQLNFSREEVEYLVRVFKVIRDVLEKLEASEEDETQGARS